MSDQPSLFFDGKTYEPSRDRTRLTGQLGRVWSVMRDGQWRSLSELQRRIANEFRRQDSEAGLSARLRDLRKTRFGAHTVQRRCRKGGHWEYRVER